MKEKVRLRINEQPARFDGRTRSQRRLGRRARAWFAWVALFLLSGFGQIIGAEEESNHAITLRLLEGRKKEQIAAAQKFQAFTGFQFSDRLTESGIRFEHRIVDDAGKEYKAAHYDHGNGLSVADVDGDELLDIYFTTQLGTNQLCRNRGQGKFEDITGAAGVGLPNQIAVAASFADIDNDNDPDLFVTTVRQGNHLFENLGGGRFHDITKQAGLSYIGHSSVGVFFDFDNDGLLDLFLANVGVYTSQIRARGGNYVALADAFHGHLYPERTEFSILYKNLGGKKFKDVSKEMNLRAGSWSGEASFADLNQDNFPDLYVLNMQGDDHYYENQRGQGFVEKTPIYFPKTPWGSMGLRFFDFNQDGLMDLYIVDMHSDMTKPQTERALNFRLEMEKTKSEAFCAIQWTEAYLQGSSNNIFGNAFFQNQGQGKFVEVSDALGVETYWPWGVSVGDLNADGFEDIFVTAGMGYPFRYGINSVLLNERGQRFFDSEFLLGIEPRGHRRTEKDWFSLDCDGADKQHPECAGKSGKITITGTLSTRSSAIFDLDEDGDLDIVTNELYDGPQVLVSNLSEKKPIHFLKVKLIGAKSNRDGLGATVTVRVGGKPLTQFNDGKSGYLAQSSSPLYFGLGDATRVDMVEVLWPSGKRQT
ncbi:MAG: CRTAC1 family protein, partial [Verrucomicrobiales bacterium]|nr:CRTAC1 family protein [Verrucomicrobiales bacterium]